MSFFDVIFWGQDNIFFWNKKVHTFQSHQWTTPEKIWEWIMVWKFRKVWAGPPSLSSLVITLLSPLDIVTLPRVLSVSCVIAETKGLILREFLYAMGMLPLVLLPLLFGVFVPSLFLFSDSDPALLILALRRPPPLPVFCFALSFSIHPSFLKTSFVLTQTPGTPQCFTESSICPAIYLHITLSCAFTALSSKTAHCISRMLITALSNRPRFNIQLSLSEMLCLSLSVSLSTSFVISSLIWVQWHPRCGAASSGSDLAIVHGLGTVYY